jgi:copper chaperone CopZ
MTCAHVVHVALKKMPGVESVDVSLNKGLATVRLRAGNTLSVQQFWQTIHQNGYTPKNTAVSVRGELVNAKGQMKLKITGTNEVLDLVADSSNAAAYKTAESKLGQTVTIEGVMMPMKNLRTAVPLEVRRIQ